MMILGVDPGSVRTGYGLIRFDQDRNVICDHGTLRQAGTHLERLQAIYEGMTRIIRAHGPDVCAVEMPVYSKNPQAMLKLGRAQAAAMLAAAHQGLVVTQYTPKEVKRAVTGNGAATKEQVAFMVRSMLGIRGNTLSLDASDALAVALCHRHRQQSGAVRPVHSDWAAFVRQNPHRAA